MKGVIVSKTKADELLCSLFRILQKRHSRL